MSTGRHPIKQAEAEIDMFYGMGTEPLYQKAPVVFEFTAERLSLPVESKYGRAECRSCYSCL